MVTTRPPKTIVKPTALSPVANTDTKLLIYSLFQKGRVLAQDGEQRVLSRARYCVGGPAATECRISTEAKTLSMGPARIREDALRILAPFRLRRRGVETKLVLGNPTKSVDRTLLRNIANALSWLDRIKAGKTYEQIATEDAIPTDRVRKAIRYAFLAPDIVRAIVEGRQPVGLTSSYLLHHPLPDDWEKQRVLVKTL